MEELNQSTVYKIMDSKIKILGLELFDILITLIISSTLNLFFDSSTENFLLSVIFPLTLLLSFSFYKRNKPDDFIINSIRFYKLPGVLCSSSTPLNENKMNIKIFSKGQDNC